MKRGSVSSHWLSSGSGLWGINKTVEKTGKSTKEVKKELQKLEAYQRTKEDRHRDKPFAKIIANPRYIRDDQWQGDLMDIETTQHGRHMNKNYRYICIFIDVYSRKVWASGIKKKTTKSIMGYAEPLLRKYKPSNLTYDRESGIRSNKMKKLLQELDIELWHPTRDQPEEKRIPGATAIVERCNRTIRKLITRYKVAHSTSRWSDVLHKLIKNYNDTPHSAFKKLPKGQRSPNYVYEHQNYIAKPRPVPKIDVGQRVRVREKKGLFQKRSLPQWSKETYRVNERYPNMYSVKDEAGKLREYNLARRDLQKIPEDTFAIPKSNRVKVVKTLDLNNLRKPFTKQLSKGLGSYWDTPRAARRIR
jgi:hypothetical protein